MSSLGLGRVRPWRGTGWWALLLLAAALGLPVCAFREPVQSVRLARPAAAGDLARLQPGDAGVLYVGFDRRLEPKEDVALYAPLLHYLERATGFRFALRPTPRGGTVVDDLGRGRVQFAIVGPLSYLEAHRRYGVRPLVRGLNEDGRPSYRSAIVTQPSSPIRQLEDLRGRRFTFGAPNSTQGYLIARILLEQAGVRLSDLGSYTSAGSHAEVADAVLSGRSDAGAMQDTLARHLADRGLVRILALSPEYPSSGIVVHPEVDPRIVDAVRRALLLFDPVGRDRNQLFQWERTEMPRGFIGSDPGDYAELEMWAERFGLIR